MGTALEKFLGLDGDVRDELPPPAAASLDSMEGFQPDSSIPYETFYYKLCVTCGAPCDLKRYFGKRKYAYPYCKKCKASYMREWRRANKMTPAQRRKDNCRSYASQYLRRGKIKRAPCKRCGDANSQMHHPDYSKPLLVEWMCRPCHLLEHHIERATVTK